MTKFGKMIYEIICICFVIATGIIVRITGGTLTSIKMFLITGWMILVTIFLCNIIISNRIFNKYLYLFKDLEEQYMLRGRIGEEKSAQERQLLEDGNYYIKQGIFGKKRNKEIETMINKINQFSSNANKGE